MKVTITSGFGEWDAAHMAHAHQGVDLAIPMDTPLRAFDSGVVTQVLDEGTKSFGKSVWIKFSDGYTAVYGHLDKVAVKPGDHIYNTRIIGWSGSTGHSTGPHLHLGIMNPDGHWIDPSHYVVLDKVLNPTVLTAPGDWADHVAQGWFEQIGNAVGNGLSELLHNMLLTLDAHMPAITTTLLIAGAFLKMFGSKKWAPKLFATAGVGAGWIILLSLD